MREIKIEYVNAGDLYPNEYNPNAHGNRTFDLLVSSIKMFGFTQPIVVQRGSNLIIDGEHRWRVAAVLGIDLVPVVYLDLSKDEMMIATVIHNISRGKHDKHNTASIYDTLTANGIDPEKVFLEQYENSKTLVNNIPQDE